MKIAAIAAVSRNNVIGRDGCMPWNLPTDMKHFRQQTMGSVVVMGRTTAESVNYSLPGRELVVISSHPRDNIITVDSAESALTKSLLTAKGRDVYIAGGERVYRELLPYCTHVYLTVVGSICEGDRYFDTTSLLCDDWKIRRHEVIQGSKDSHVSCRIELSR